MDRRRFVGAVTVRLLERLTNFRLGINKLRTARALGLTIPPPLALRANEVIQ